MGNCFGRDQGPDDNGRPADPVSNLELLDNPLLSKAGGLHGA